MTVENIGDKCCGCRSCLQKCKANAISFVTDVYGFEYPKVDTNMCVNCGACEKVCPILNDAPSVETDLCGTAYALDAQTKYEGSSGGLFGVFAKTAIDNGGVVFGAAFDESLKLKTTRAETYEELVPLYKSKYLLCDTAGQFKIIEGELIKGRKVLYCSSPCQIAALKLYLNRQYDNLFTIDFLCHGVGSQNLFDRSVEYIQKKELIEIEKMMLRAKKPNQASHHYYLYGYLKDGEYYEKSALYLHFPYYNAYCKQLACRDSCYNCKFYTRERVGDVTIGDFFTIEKYNANIDRFAGVSMLLVNTPKGHEWFDAVKDKVFWQEMCRETIYKNNRFSKKEGIPAEQPAFRESIADEPFETTVKRFLKPSRDWLKLIYYKMPKFMRKTILKLK